MAHECVGADGVVVARDGELDDIGVDVGVDNSNHGDLQLVGLGHRDVLLLGVQDEDAVGALGHVADAAQVLLQLLELARQQQRFLLRHGLELASGAHALVLLHLGDALGDGLEVGEHATEPTLVDVVHAALLGVAAHGILRLLLGADEEDRAALGGQVANEVVCGFDARHRLVEVDDVDAVALTEDETLHLRVPPTGLVPEVDTGFQHLAHRDDSHGDCSSPAVGGA